MSFIDPIKSVSTKSVEESFAKALSELTGCKFSVSITSLSFANGEISMKLYKLPGDDEISLPF